MNTNNMALSDSQIINELHRKQTSVKTLNFVAGLSAFLGGFGVIIGLILGMMNRESIAIYGFAGLGVSVICIPIAFAMKKARIKKEKELKRFSGTNVTKGIIEEKIQIEEYDPTGCFKNSFLRNSGIVPAFDNLFGSDYIKGYYKGKRVVMSDTKLELVKTERNDNGRKREREITVFNGIFISIDLGKELDGYVKICERKNPKKKQGFVKELLSNALYTKGIKLGPDVIEVENIAFNERFEIKTNDKELAFYILTPHFMENILKADDLAEGYTNIKFSGKKAQIAINNGRDSFELEKVVSNQGGLDKARENMRSELNVLLSIVDEILEKERLFEA